MTESDHGEETMTEEPKKDVPQPMVTVREMFQFADETDALLMLVGSIGAMIRGAALPAFSLMFGEIIDVMFALERDGAAAESLLWPAASRFLWAALAVFIAATLQVMCWTWAGERQARRIRESYMHAVLRQEVGWFDAEGSNEIYSRIAGDLGVIQTAISVKFGSMIEYLSQFVAGFILGFYQGWLMTLVLIAVVPALAVSAGVMMFLFAKLGTQGQAAYAKAGAVALETMTGIRTVAAFGGEHREIKNYEKHLEDAKRVGTRSGLVNGVGFGTVMCFIYLAYALALWFGSTRVLVDTEEYCLTQFAGNLTMACFDNPQAFTNMPGSLFDGYNGGKVMTVLFAVIIGAFALGQVGPPVQALAAGRGAAYVVFNTIKRKSACDPFAPRGSDDAPVPDPSSKKNKIEFQDVSFRYPSRPEVLVLNKFSLQVRPGQTVAFVGGSGCGKSTTFALLERFYEPDSGSITIGGRPLASLNVHEWRSKIGYVGQQPTLFSGTIADNIAQGTQMTNAQAIDLANGKPVVSREDIIKAAKAANAHDFIESFPHGYDTVVGAKGAQLSGGQKQRVAIARAFVRDPEILLLDEATSALDTHSEAVVQAALDKVMVGRTTFVIAHRLATIRDADTIVVMAEGAVLEMGTFAELTGKENGAFRRMAAAQGLVDSDDADSDDMASAASSTMVVEDESGSEDVFVADDDTPQPATQKTKKVKMSKEAEKHWNEVEKRAAAGDAEAIAMLQARDAEEDASEADIETKSPFGRVVGMSKPEFPMYALGCVFAMINGAKDPVFAFVLTKMLAVFYGPLGGIKDGARLWSLIFVGIGFVTFMAVCVQSLLFAIGAQRLIFRIRSMTFRSIVRQEVSFFDSKRHSAAVLAARLATDAQLVSGVFGEPLGLMFQNLATAVLGLGIAFYFGWKLTLVLLATVPFLVFGQMVEFIAFQGINNESDEAMAQATAIASEAVSDIRTTSALTSELLVWARYKRALDHPYALAVKRAWTQGLVTGVSQGMIFATYTLNFWYGGTLILRGEMSSEDMLMVFMAILFTAMGLGSAAGMMPDAGKANAGARSVFRLIDRESNCDPESTSGDLVRGDLTVTMSKVDFTYPTRRQQQVLNGMSFVMKPGKVLALVGESGCGKSSSIGLLERYYEPDGGEVLVNGVPLASLNVRAWRRHIGYVGQEPQLFTGTVRENILYGMSPEEQVTDAELEAVAKDANAHDFICELPDKYDTFLGENGTQLSGGQKQRIAIARAIVRKPTILLLDEATSALDSKSERVVQDALDRAMKGRTTIVIAHRLSTIKDADEIAVISKGRVVESGKHKRLLAAKGEYYKLVRRQTQEN